MFPLLKVATSPAMTTMAKAKLIESVIPEDMWFSWWLPLRKKIAVHWTTEYYLEMPRTWYKQAQIPPGWNSPKKERKNRAMKVDSAYLNTERHCHLLGFAWTFTVEQLEMVSLSFWYSTQLLWKWQLCYSTIFIVSILSPNTGLAVL